MNTLLALTITLPDWLLSFWGGYISGFGLGFAVYMALSHIKR